MSRCVQKSRHIFIYLLMSRHDLTISRNIFVVPVLSSMAPFHSLGNSDQIRRNVILFMCYHWHEHCYHMILTETLMALFCSLGKDS